MFTLTRTREDLRADPELAGVIDIEAWDPLVRWVPHMGMFCLAHVAIRFCPWCGAPLPTPEDPAPEAHKPAVRITVTPAGDVHATVDGEPVDAAQIIRMITANDPGDRPAGA